MINFDNVGYTYDRKTYVLDDVNLDIGEGQFVCILGGNGSGKSTLAKQINALLTPDRGTVTVLDHDTEDPKNTYFVRSNAGMVFQNPDDQLVATLVEDDVAFGPENLGIPTPQIRDRVTESLKMVGLSGYEKHETHALSGGQKQRVAIAGALAMHPRILIFDEASAMLDPAGRKSLQKICKKLNGEGYTIVMITHFMEEATLADEILVMQNGKIVTSGSPQTIFAHPDKIEHLDLDTPFAATLCHELQDRHIPIRMHVKARDTQEEIVHLFANIYGSLPHVNDKKIQGYSARYMKAITQARLEQEKLRPQPKSNAGATVEVQHLSYTYDPLSKKQKRTISKDTEGISWALHDLSFILPAGEFLGIAGHTGSGKSTLLQMLNGLLQPTIGQVFINGHNMSDKQQASQTREKVGLVFQYPEKQLFAATVAEDVAFGPKNLGCTDAEIEQRTNRALELVGLDPAEVRDKNPFTLSGGQQRRVAFAGVLAMRPSTLVLDEPCAGLDPKNHQAFLDLIAHLHDELKITVIMVSHSMDDLAQTCDRLLVLDDGEIVAYDTPEKVFRNGDALREIGLDQPQPQKMAESLARAGIPLPMDKLYDMQTLVDSLVGAYIHAHHQQKPGPGQQAGGSHQVSDSNDVKGASK